jgi:hypothetical protein
MKVKAQAPFPRLEIYPHDGKEHEIVLDSSVENGELLSYTFSNDINSLDGEFSFSVLDAMDNEKNKRLFKSIQKRMVVKIYEGGTYPVFIGVIHEKRVTASIMESGVKRSIQFSGTNILGLLSDFILSLDVKLMNLKDAGIYSEQLTIALAKEHPEKLTVREFLKVTLENYVNLTLDNMNISSTDILKTLRTHVDENLDIFRFEEGKEDAPFYFPIACAFYTQGENRITEIWRNILAHPVYEMFPVITDGRPGIMVREAPFDPVDWLKLRKTRIRPIDLTDYDLLESDKEVYTFFNCFLVGEANSLDQETIIAMVVHGGGVTITDQDKFSLYGYRPLEIAFRGYARRNNLDSESGADIKEIKQDLNARAREWFGKLDDMLSGTLSLITNFNEKPGEGNPKTGEKIQLLDGEFYVVHESHSWSYGGAPKLSLTVNRGCIYNQEGAYSKAMENAGIRLSELEGEE